MQQQFLQYFLHAGYIFISEQPYMIHTVLGSCVSVCLWDERKKQGGMNHYIYSVDLKNERNCKYGDVSLPLMINMMVQNGSLLSNLKAHVIGGGNNLGLNPKIGENNIQIADRILEKAGIPVLIRNVGGRYGRKVVFNNQTGEADVFCNGSTCAQFHLRQEKWINSMDSGTDTPDSMK